MRIEVDRLLSRSNSGSFLITIPKHLALLMNYTDQQGIKFVFDTERPEEILITKEDK